MTDTTKERVSIVLNLSRPRIQIGERSEWLCANQGIQREVVYRPGNGEHYHDVRIVYHGGSTWRELMEAREEDERTVRELCNGYGGRIIIQSLGDETREISLSLLVGGPANLRIEHFDGK